MAESTPSLIEQLRAIAKAASSSSFSILTEERVAIAVSHSGGSSESITLSAPYDAHACAVAMGDPAPLGYRDASVLSAIRPMRIALSRETDTHKDAKFSGINIEFQTGDDAFDRDVYIDAPSSDPLPSVLSPDVRAAVLSLCALEFTRIEIDDVRGYITASRNSFSSSTLERSDAGRATTTAFARLARGVPQIAKRAGEHERLPLESTIGWLFTSAVFGTIGAVPFYLLVSAKSGVCHEDMTDNQASTCLGPLAVGFGIAFLLALFATVFARERVRFQLAGRSDSARRLSLFSWSFFFTVFPAIGSILALIFARTLWSEIL